MEEGARTVIRVEDVHKRYRLGVIGTSAIAEELAATWARVRGRPDPRLLVENTSMEQRRGENFWALAGISFEVRRGEVLGIVGRNGAGKSTLLKVLSRITAPTSGRIAMRGRLSSLLEVGTGFHPELTGLENVHLNGAILGMRRAEIARKLDDIIAFSGIEHHIGTPIKKYSSAMKVRLGFAVAAHLDPDILIVDEVLAVGDAEFQRKCLASMRAAADHGRTILMVSHNTGAIFDLCKRAIWLDKGRLVQDGPATDVVRAYLEKYAGLAWEQRWGPENAPGSEELRLTAVRAVSEGVDNGGFNTGLPVRIELDLLNTGVLDDDLDITLQVNTHNEVVAFASSMEDCLGRKVWSPGPCKVVCEVPADLLNEGGYRFSLSFVRNGRTLFRVRDAAIIEVRGGDVPTGRPGVVHPLLRWSR